MEQNIEQRSEQQTTFDLLVKGCLIELDQKQGDNHPNKISFRFLDTVGKICSNDNTRIVGGYLTLRMLEKVINEAVQKGDINVELLQKTFGPKLTDILSIFQPNENQFNSNSPLKTLGLRLNDLLLNVLNVLTSYNESNSNENNENIPNLLTLIQMTKNTLNPQNWDIGLSSQTLLERIQKIIHYCERLIPQEKISKAQEIVQQEISSYKK